MNDTPTQDSAVLFLERADKRLRDLKQRIEAGEDVSNGEIIDVLTDFAAVLRDTVVMVAGKVDR